MDVDALLHEIETYFRLSKERPKPVRVLDALLRVADRGRAHLLSWQEIGRLLLTDTGLVDLAGQFFMLTAVAHLETAALHAAKLFDTHRAAVSMTFFLNTIRDHGPQTFGSDELPAVERALTSTQRRIDSLQTALRQIRQKRNRDLAHLDARNIDLADDIQAVEAANVSLVFDAVDQIALEMGQSSRAFAQIARVSLEDTDDFIGPRGIQDLIYFARVAFQDPAVPSPSPRVEKIRDWDRHIRQVRSELSEEK